MSNAEYEPGMGFTQIWGVLFLRWRIVVTAVVSAFLLSLLFTAGRGSPQETAPVADPVSYGATARYAVALETPVGTPIDESVRASRELARSFAFAMTTDAVMGTLAADLGLEYEASELRGILSVGVVDGTGFISVTAVSEHPGEALAVANGLAAAVAATPAYSELALGGVHARLEQVEASDTATVRNPVVPAVRPVDPVNPVITFTLVGLFIGGFAALAIDWIDGRAHWPGQVSRDTGLNLVGLLGGRRRKSQAIDLFAGEDERGMDSFRAAKARLRALMALHAGPHRILIASPGAREGKSTVTSNLAEALTEDGSRVAIVSVDMRSEAPAGPGTDGRVMTERPGLSEYLLDPSLTIADILCESGHPGVTVVGRGCSPAAAVPMLDSARMKDLLDRLAADADWVLLDGPAILSSSDAPRMAGSVDGTLLVVDGALTSLQSIRRAVDSLEAAGARILGFFHNRVQPNPVARVLHLEPV